MAADRGWCAQSSRRSRWFVHLAMALCLCASTLALLSPRLPLACAVVSLGHAATVAQVLALEAGLSLSRSLAFFVPSGLGVQDLAWVTVLRALGVPDAHAVGATFVAIKRVKEPFWILLGWTLFGALRRDARSTHPWPRPPRVHTQDLWRLCPVERRPRRIGPSAAAPAEYRPPIPPRERPMSNRFVHTELSTTNVAAAKEFYASLFDWEFEDVPFGDVTYTMLRSGDQGIGGIQVKPIAEAPTAWLPYVEVDDVRETLAKARAAGAVILVDYTEIGANGAMGIFLDPTGAALGVWTPAIKPAEKPAKRPKKTDAEKEARKAEKRARKAAKRAKAAEKAEEKQAKKAAKKAKAAEKAAKKRRAEAHVDRKVPKQKAPEKPARPKRTARPTAAVPAKRSRRRRTTTKR